LFSINEVHLDHLVRSTVMKQTEGQQVPDIAKSYRLMLWNLHDVVSNFKAYNMVQWAKYIDHWSSTQGRRYTTAYSRGEILMADLGAMNYGYEFSYPHPCVVVYETVDMLFVVPGSSKRFGRNHRGIIDATRANDGFDKDTGLLLYNMRWIHKNRVKHTTGRQTSPRVLQDIEQFILKLNHEFHQEIRQRAQSNKRLRANVYQLHQQIQQHRQTIQDNEQKLQENAKKIKRQEQRLKKYKEHLTKVHDLLEMLKHQGLRTEVQEFMDTMATEKWADAENE